MISLSSRPTPASVKLKSRSSAVELSPRSTIELAAALMHDAAAYAGAARSPATLRAYDCDWRHFAHWCAVLGVEALPADPQTVALYVADLAQRYKPSTITRRCAAISVLHQHAGFASPTSDARVRDVARGVRRTLGNATAEARPVMLGDLRRMIAHLPDDLSGIRDRAILLVGFAGALRRSELVAINVDDLGRRDEGRVVRIRRGKTDQEAVGRAVALPFGHDQHTCPVTALDRWLEAAEIVDGPVFRPVDRHDQVRDGRLTGQSVTLVLQRAAVRAGLDTNLLTGHSLRAGFATAAAAAGATESSIARQTGHASMEMLRRYVRHGSMFTDNAVTRIGL